MSKCTSNKQACSEVAAGGELEKPACVLLNIKIYRSDLPEDSPIHALLEDDCDYFLVEIQVST